MSGPTHSLEAWVVGRKLPSDTFQALTLYSAELGATPVLQRLSKKANGSPALDLFDHAAVVVEEPLQGPSWFVKDARILKRHQEIGKSYEALSYASRLAILVTQNPVAEETRPAVFQLLSQAWMAFAESHRPEIVFLKALYRFCRDEGYPVKQGWLPTLTTSERDAVTSLLNQPLAAQTVDTKSAARLLRRLEDFLRQNTEILLE